jgi:hypothetical protein
MLPDQTRSLSTNTAFTFPFGILSAATEYVVDTAQRTTLFWDGMPQRGNQFRERLTKTAPHVLEYEVELITGRTLDRMVNCERVRVIPLAGIETDTNQCPFSLVRPIRKERQARAS